MNSNIIVVGIGEILWDVFPERKVLGGAPANFAYHVSQFGYDGYALSAVGDDPLGKEVLDSLRAKEMKYLIDVVDYPTGTVQVTLDDKGVPAYEITQNVAWDNIPFTSRTENLAQNTQTVCFGSLAQRSEVSRNTIRKFISSMPSDALKIFDINLRQHFYTKEIIEESLNMSNMLKINDEEVVTVSKLFGINGDETEICNILRERYSLKLVVLTKGADGSYVFTADKTYFQPTPKVHVADTVGAGDSFTAAFTAAYLAGESVENAHQLAVEVSAYVCQHNGAMPRLADSHRQLFR